MDFLFLIDQVFTNNTKVPVLCNANYSIFLKIVAELAKTVAEKAPVGPRSQSSVPSNTLVDRALHPLEASQSDRC